MVTQKNAIIFVLFAMSSMWAMPMAQQSTSGISSACTTVLVSLSPCLDYISGNSTTPSSSCCSQLANVVGSSPQCLCEVLNGGASDLAAGLNINRTQALALPNACNVQTPPVSRCNANSPTGSPFGSPSGGGSRTTPTGGDSSDTKMSKLPATIPMLVVTVFVALAV